MARKKSVLTEKERNVLAKCQGRAVQLRESFAEQDPGEKVILGAFVLREHYFMALEILPKLLAAAGEAEIPIEEKAAYNEDELIAEMGAA